MKIAFGYKMRVGKDTACDYLQKKYGGKKLSFAKPIYDILYFSQSVCGFEKEKDRKFLQFIGTEWGRKKDKNIWVNILLKNVKENTNYFISDLRFINEFEELKKNGWICVKIVRDNVQKDDHISENELDFIQDWDYVIHNNGSIEQFIRKLDLLIKEK